MGSLKMEEPWWKGDLAAEIHRTLRLKELKLPVYKAHSPQIGMRRYFADLLAILSNRCQLCPTARHLAVYLLDLFMDRYDVAVKQLYVISIACLLLASKFEEKEDKVPKLDQLNSFAYMCSLNLALTKKDLLKMELLLLENFNWNLCLPTPAHYIDYYLFASVSESDLHNGWPITSVTKVRAFMEKYSHYFLEVSLQDHVFLSFRPSLVAAACVGASRICLEVSPSWTAQLQLLTCYSWEHLAPCIELMLIAHDKDIKEANKEKDRVKLLQQQQQVVESLTLQTPTQVLFQQSRYHPLAQHSAVVSQFHSPIQDLCSAYRDSLQAPRLSGLASGHHHSDSLHSYSALQASFQPVLQTVSIQGPITMQVAISTEPRHCLALTYGSSYFSGHHSYTTGCFDG
ncbi:cyclin-J-like protein [Zootoca vivipara]|uniref:cyclin-J-like protein n=1 Tax=Zootoca vivipara TaxID=8524 RepID=UPI0015908BF5|nr:cyclin-J-like protein [Zootoca vivipara]